MLEGELQAKDQALLELKQKLQGICWICAGIDTHHVGIESERAAEVKALIALEHDLELQGFKQN